MHSAASPLECYLLALWWVCWVPSVSTPPPPHTHSRGRVHRSRTWVSSVNTTKSTTTPESGETRPFVCFNDDVPSSEECKTRGRDKSEWGLPYYDGLLLPASPGPPCGTPFVTQLVWLSNMCSRARFLALMYIIARCCHRRWMSFLHYGPEGKFQDKLFILLLFSDNIDVNTKRGFNIHAEP